MRNKGFTLIELLAVIVILAIIALIATPIVIGIISSAKEESNEKSIQLYGRSIDNAVAQYRLNNPDVYLGSMSEEERLTAITPYIEYDGNKVECDTQIKNNGEVSLTNCKVEGKEVPYTYGEVEESTEEEGSEVIKPCTLNDLDNSGDATLSDEITCGTETFYVMYSDDTTITMLTKNNLSNSFSVFSRDAYYYDHTNNTYKQEYKKDSGGYYYVYDSNSIMYSYVNNYEQKLRNDLNVTSAKATLINYEQLKMLGCNNRGCSSKQGGSSPEWVYLVNHGYWTGLSDSRETILFVKKDGSLVSALYDDAGVIDYWAYARPVVTISIYEI